MRSKQLGEDTADNENKWLCNGAADYGFVGGCKGNQTDLDFHEQMSGYLCEEHDVDFCEHCIRWAMHCEKTKKPLGIVTDRKSTRLNSSHT